MRIHPFDSMRFHVLLNSLFKVLFNFPSRYLSAIGLVPVFSLRWSLPPALGCIPKQPDSEEARSRRVSRRKGPTPALGETTIRRVWALDTGDNRPPIHHISRRPMAGRFGAGLVPLHSPLLRESWLVSFPPLTDMLKFSGYSRLIRGRMCETPAVGQVPRWPRHGGRALSFHGWPCLERRSSACADVRQRTEGPFEPCPRAASFRRPPRERLKSTADERDLLPARHANAQPASRFFKAAAAGAMTCSPTLGQAWLWQ